MRRPYIDRRVTTVNIDLVVLALLLLAGLLGLASGAIRQLAHLGGLVAGWFSALPLAQLAGPSVAARYGYHLLLTTVAACFVCFFLVYLAVVLLLRFVLGRVLPDGEKGMADRFGGFALGAVKGAALAFMVVSAVVVAEKYIVKLWPEFRKETAPSVAVRIARQHGLFASLPVVNGLEKILDVAADPRAVAKLVEDPDFSALMRDPRIKGMANDRTVLKALQGGDVASLLSNVRVLDALNDPKLLEKLVRFQSGGGLERAGEGSDGGSLPAEKPASR